MSKWSMDEDEDYFRIFDPKKEIAGYFDPDYRIAGGDASEQIERIIRERIPVGGGYLMVPLAKFGIFDTDYASDLDSLGHSIESVASRIRMWKEFISKDGIDHTVRISHTDHDMLSITFPVAFEKPVPIDKNIILPLLEPTLEMLSGRGLL